MCKYERERSLEGFELTNGCQFGEVTDNNFGHSNYCIFHVDLDGIYEFGKFKKNFAEDLWSQSHFQSMYQQHIQNEKVSDKAIIDLTGAILTFDLIIDAPEENHILLDGATIQGNVSISNIGRKCTVSMNDLEVKEGGQITLSGPELGSVILTNSNCASLNIETKEIRGNLRLHNLKLDHEIKLPNISVFGPTSFKDVQCKEIDFNGSTFLDHSSFENVSVSDGFNASDSKWQGLKIENFRCENTFMLDNSDFKKDFTLNDSIIEAYTSFQNSHFHKEALFKNLEFKDDFRVGHGSKFEADATFKNIKAWRVLSLTESHFKQRLKISDENRTT